MGLVAGPFELKDAKGREAPTCPNDEQISFQSQTYQTVAKTRGGGGGCKWGSWDASELLHHCSEVGCVGGQHSGWCSSRSSGPLLGVSGLRCR
ncbi:hypothetical protein Pyn_21307 [Prunus yedoensis var. nudiflora]|uniref:Uncharacterized protein n=1 Tax=Prunus yedoensis var. nudiflora TaxID=2094558 RepID=A0A314V239_PRUYE|nr:hypothetical protein Pyn_21307 [Prunus yedoensis var. nudiflora]